MEQYSMDEYQAAAMRTCTHERGSCKHSALAWNALGLAGEAGEVADEIKKIVGHGHALDKDKLKKEIGDCCWYIAALCNDLGLDMSDVAMANIEKLKKRYPDGFSQEASKNRTVEVMDIKSFCGCPWCNGKGCLACPSESDKEYKRQFPDGPKPIATFKTDDPVDMERARKTIGIEALNKAFWTGGRGVQEIIDNIEASK